MRVFYSVSKGIATIDGKRIYGYALGMEPTTITWEQYINNRAALIQAPFDKEYLEKRTGKVGAPDIRFTLEELRYIKYPKLRSLSAFMGIEENDVNARSLMIRLHKVLENL